MPSFLLKSAILASLTATLLLTTGCKSKQGKILDNFPDDVNKEVVGWGLRQLDPKDYPDMTAAWADKTNLERAINKSLEFLAKPSTRRFYPSQHPGDTITHDQIVYTLHDIKALIAKNITPEQFQQEILSRYDVYTSKGYNDKGDVWFTGYYTPIYQGSLTPTSEYKYPIYRRPADLQSDPITGEVHGAYPTRRELVTSGKLKGLEFIYFKKPIEPFIIQVQGSAKVILPNGKEMFIGYAGHNGGKHRGLGQQLLEEKKIDPKHLSLPAVLEYYDNHPGEIDEAIMRDDRFVFLKEYSGEWPAGSLGVQVTADRSLATDKSIFPRASLTFIDVTKPDTSGVAVPYKGFVLDQDSGGAIRAAGRADIYMGIGEEAGRRAGSQYAQGRLYYFFLKPALMNPANYPNLKPTPAPKAVTPGTPKAPANPKAPKPPATGGGDEMFPGAVKK